MTVIKTLKMLKFDWFKVNFDFIFLSLAVISFYSSPWILMLSWFVFIYALRKLSYYHKCLDSFYLDAFIDFLNQINANLSIGMGFDTAIIASSKMLKSDKSYSSATIQKLNKTIQMGISSELLFQNLCDRFPIYEATLFSRMMKLSKETGANPSKITGITIDKLYMKFKVTQEIEMILYQKKLEQTILCIAPMFIILFIRFTSPGYMDVLYQTLFGRIVMTFALSLILLMKFISERIVKFKY